MRWTESETRLFVKLLHSHPPLWDTKDEGFRSQEMRDEAYQDIVTKFNALTNILLDKSRVKLKVKSLRSTYAQELAKMRKRPGVYKPNIKWFYYWYKCFGTGKQQVSVSNEESTNESGDEEPIEFKIDIDESWLEEEILEEDKNEQCLSNDDDYVLLLKAEPEDEQPVERPEEQLEKNIEEQPETTYKKRKIKHHPEIEFSNSIFKAKEDEFDIYGKFIATQLRNMGIEQALKVQMQIHNIVSSARIESLTSSRP